MEQIFSRPPLLVLVSVVVGHLFTRTALGLRVSVNPDMIRQYQGTTIEIQCSVRNVKANAILIPYWFHTFAPDMNRVVAVSTAVRSPYRDRSSIAAYYYIGGLDYILRIHNLMPEDAGTYLCSVHYQSGNSDIFQDSVTVTVLNSPSSPSCFPDGPVTVMEGGLLAMSCSSDSLDSPDDLRVQWQSPKGVSHTGPADSDWNIEARGNEPIWKLLTIVGDIGYNNSWFVCSAAREEDTLSLLVFETCSIGPITIILAPPQMRISVEILHPQFPLQDGNTVAFACEVNLTQPPTVLRPTLEASWDISPQIDPVRVFKSSQPDGRSIVIKLSHQDNGAVLSCGVTYSGMVYRDNITLEVSPVVTTAPDQITEVSPIASRVPDLTTILSYPTTATILTSASSLLTPVSQPWYSTQTGLILIALSAILLVFILILISYLVARGRNRRRKQKPEEEEAELHHLSRYPPPAVNPRPTSENIYHELSDQCPLQDVPETQGSTSPEVEQPYSECRSPQPVLEVYAETVENILYVPSVKNSAESASSAVHRGEMGHYESETLEKADNREGPYTYASVV